jgi:hypothetical protein
MIRATIFLLILTSCNTLTVMCPEMAEAQYQRAVKKYGLANVQKWKMKNENPKPYPFHNQIKVCINGAWRWLPNRRYTEVFSSEPQPGCTPHKRLK